MPHDRNGSQLKPGDTVTLTATVESVSLTGETGCNVTLILQGTEEQYHTHVTCNSQLCEKAGVGDLTAAARKGFGPGAA